MREGISISIQNKIATLISKGDFLKDIMSLLVLVVINLVIYHEYWFAIKIFTGKDILTAFSPLLNFQSDCLQELSMPLWNPYMNFGYPFVEHYSNTTFFPSHFLMGLITGSSIWLIQREILLWIVAGGFGIYLCVRELGLSRLTGILAGTSFMFCGQLIALPQWHLLVYNATCFPFLLLGYYRAVRYVTPFSLTTIAFMTMAIFGGHITTTVLGIYIFILYVLIDSAINNRIFFAIKYLFVTLALSALLASPKLAPLYQATQLGPRMKAPDSLHTKDTVNIINLYNFMSFFLPVKYYFSLYIGQLSMIALIYAILKKKVNINALLVVFILTAWFLAVDNEGNVSWLRSMANFLPLMKLVRNEWLMWFYPSIFLILYLSKYYDLFLLNKDIKLRIISVITFLLLLSVMFFGQYNTLFYIRAYITSILIAMLWFVIGFFYTRNRLRAVFCIILITAEFFIVFKRVNVDEPPGRDDSRIMIAVVDQGSVSRSLMDDNRVRYKFYAMAVQDNLRPSISQSRAWPYLISGLGGAITYNVYPEQYGNFIDYMNMKKFAGWWYNAQERFEFIKIKDSPMLAQMENQPLFIYFSQITGMPISNAVSFSGISCSSFTFDIKFEDPGFFLLHQMYDDRWSVLVDGRRRKPVLANEFFMGVDVWPGEHKVEFIFRDKLFNISLIISLMTLTVILIVLTANRFKSPMKGDS